MGEQQMETIIDTLRKVIRKAIADIVSNIRNMLDKVFKSLITWYSSPRKVNLIKHKEHRNAVLYKLNPQVINIKPKYIRCRNSC